MPDSTPPPLAEHAAPAAPPEQAPVLPEWVEPVVPELAVLDMQPVPAFDEGVPTPELPSRQAHAEGSAAPLEPGPAPSPAAAVPDLSPAQCSARLAALFPALFGLHQPHPLKLRIQADIQARAPGLFNRKSLSAFLHRYTTGTPYLLALSRSPQRRDLDGAPAGEVADEHREAAVAEVARRRGLMDARRAAVEATRKEADNLARQQHEAELQGRRDRAAMLRAFETSTLTRANFCALKRLQDSELDGLLARARQEAAERPTAPPVADRADRADRAGPQPGSRDDPRGRSRGDPRPDRKASPGDNPRQPGPEWQNDGRAAATRPPGPVPTGDRPPGTPHPRQRRPRPGP